LGELVDDDVFSRDRQTGNALSQKQRVERQFGQPRERHPFITQKIGGLRARKWRGMRERRTASRKFNFVKKSELVNGKGALSKEILHDPQQPADFARTTDFLDDLSRDGCARVFQKFAAAPRNNAVIAAPVSLRQQAAVMDRDAAGAEIEALLALVKCQHHEVSMTNCTTVTRTKWSPACLRAKRVIS